MSHIQEYFRGKTVLVTGATGFLGKALVEKILRSLPDLGRLYLLIRPRERGSRTLSAEQRFRAELLKSSVFDRLKREQGASFDAYVDSRVGIVAGELADERLGVSDEDYQRLTAEVQILINSAAVVVFDERLDLALNLNTFGARRMLDFARDCRRLEAAIHISTCYVSGMRSGWVKEEVPPLPFDADEEAARLAEECAVLNRRHADQPSLAKERLVQLGLQRARQRGWNDTYTFTKALGEQLLVRHRGDLPTVILRPAIIESAFAEPEPGWIDGFRMADPLFVGYGKGYLQDFPGRPDTITDLIPCDHVVNAILAAAPRCAAEGGLKVYQVATGQQNPVQFRTIYQAGREHFTQDPLRDREGKLIAQPEWSFPESRSYRRKLVWRYRAPLQAGLTLLRPFSFFKPLDRLRRRLKTRRASLDLLLYYVDIYSPYTNIASRYEATNTAQLWASLTPEDQRLFPFDATGIDWRDYIANVHIPGLRRHVLNQTTDELGEGMGVPVRTIPDLLARSADRFPEAVALQIKRGDQWVRYTFDEVERWVQEASAVLTNLGLGQGEKVVLYAENQPEWGMAYLAAVSLGLVVVPVDRQLAEHEVLAVARFVDARALLVSEGTYGTFGEEARRSTAQPLLNINAGCTPFSPLTPNPSPQRGEGRPEPLTPNPSPQRGEGGIIAPLSPLGRGVGGEGGEPHLPSVLINPDDVASILFTTSVSSRDPRGVQLTHRNFLANVMGVVQLLPPRPRDNFLSVLPLHHALEFTGGFLVPLYVGAKVTYCDSVRSRVVLDTLRESQATCLIGAPRVFQILHEAMRQQVAHGSRRARLWFDLQKTASRLVSALTGRNVGRRLFAGLHRQLGGKLRAFISGGAALAPRIFDNFTAMGFELCEGYGLTETAPIATVNPLGSARKGSVGLPLPGVEVRIHNPDERGVGEVLVRGPNLTPGYFRNPEATARAMPDGWLHTGDVGYLDRRGYLFLTGRSKDVIVTPAGKNVYPEEVEQLYAGLPGVSQLCVVGIWDEEVLGETIHAVIVPRPDAPHRGPGFEETLRQAIQQRGHGIPRYQRLQRLHLVDEELPQTLAGGIDRPRVKQRLLQRLRASGPEGLSVPEDSPGGPPEPLEEEVGSAAGGHNADVESTVLNAVSRLAGVPRTRVTRDTQLENDLHLDTLLRAELLVNLEADLQAHLPDELASSLRTVGDVLEAVKQRLGVAGGGVAVAEQVRPSRRRFDPQVKARRTQEEAYWLRSSWLEGTVRLATRRLMRLYAWAWFHFEVHGADNLPQGPFIVAANHCSHLDTGAVVTAFGPRGGELFIMGARDYFFNYRAKGWFFHTFLNVIPFDRTEHVIESLRLAQAVLRAGRPVLIYPEGRRSPTGALQPFKSGIGLLAVELGVPIVPCLIEGTYQAMPKGRLIPRRSHIRVTFAPPVSLCDYHSRYPGLDRRELWRRAADEVRGVVDRLRQGRQA